MHSILVGSVLYRFSKKWWVVDLIEKIAKVLVVHMLMHQVCSAPRTILDLICLIMLCVVILILKQVLNPFDVAIVSIFFLIILLV